VKPPGSQKPLKSPKPLTPHGRSSGRLAIAGATIALLSLPLSNLHSQTTQEELPSGTAKPYGPGFPFLPEEDPMVELPGLERPPNTVLDEPAFYQEWEQRWLRPDKTPAELDPTERMELPVDTPNFSIPDTPTPSPAELQLREMGREAYETIEKTSRLFGMEIGTINRTTPAVPEPRLVFEKEKARRLRLGPVRTAFEATQSFAYNTNVFGSRDHPVGDAYTIFQPSVVVETGTRGLASLLYRPTLIRYATYEGMNSWDESLVFNLRYPFSKLELASDVVYLTQSGLFVNSEGFTEARSLLGRFFGSYAASPKFSLFFDYTARDDQADPGGSATENALLLSGNYRWNDAIGGGPSVQVGRVNADFGHQTYYVLQGQASFRPSYHFKFEGRGGMQFRQFSREVAGKGALATPVFDVTGSYHWNDNTAFVLRGYRSIATVTFDRLHLDIETGIESYALVRLFGTTDIKMHVKGGYVEKMANTSPETGDFCFLQGGLSVSLAVSKMWELFAFNNIQQRFGDSQGANYISNITGVGWTLRF